MENLRWFLDGLMLALLGGIGILLLWFHIRLRHVVKANVDVPFLSAKLAKSLAEAGKGIKDLKQIVHQHAGDLDAKLLETSRTLQEVTYVVDRAEKVLTELDTRLAQANKLGANGIKKPDIPEKKIAPFTPPRVDGAQVATKKAAPKKMVSPARSSTAYGEAEAVREKKSSATMSETEQELRRALQERL